MRAYGGGGGMNRGGMIEWAVAAAVGEVLIYLAWRPRMLRWGATDQEARSLFRATSSSPRP